MSEEIEAENKIETRYDVYILYLYVSNMLVAGKGMTTAEVASVTTP